MAKSPNWTQDELDILISKYPEIGSGPGILKFLPGRTSKSINIKASRMGLKINFDRNWQEGELDILNEVYPTHGSDEYLQKLLPNRTSESIKLKASRLGIECTNLKGKKKPIEVYLEELSATNFTLLGEYTCSKDKTLHRCNVCGYEWLVIPGNLIRGTGCPNCATKLPFNHAIGSIYLLKVITLTETFLKIGITSRNVLNRIVEIAKELNISTNSISVILSKEGPGIRVSTLEKAILTNNTLVRFRCSSKFSGCTELFNISEEQKIIKILNDKNF